MKATGHLRKMRAQATQPVEYCLIAEPHQLPLNEYLGYPLQLRFTGNIYCIQCGRKTRKSFQQGYCFPCMQRLAECRYCIIHPEKCRVNEGACAPDDWAHAQCAQPHIVYLANSSGLKVGVTRCSQIPTRWIDQGASQALPIMQVANRYQAGTIEICLKQFVSDRTDWRKLLKQIAQPLDLYVEREKLAQQAQPALQAVMAQFPEGAANWLTDAVVTQLEYPVRCYPQKAISLSFDESPVVDGVLQGIKGQYLLLDTGVINIRKFAGYEVEYSGEK